jgi:hypothetical protein
LKLPGGKEQCQIRFLFRLCALRGDTQPLYRLYQLSQRLSLRE